MYSDFDSTVVDFNEFVLSFQYEVDKMKVFEARPWSVRVESVMPAPLTTIKLIPQQTHQQKEHLVNL